MSGIQEYKIQPADLVCDLRRLAALPDANILDGYEYYHSYIYVESADSKEAGKLYYIREEGKAKKVALKDAEQFKRKLGILMGSDRSKCLTSQQVTELITANSNPAHQPDTESASSPPALTCVTTSSLFSCPVVLSECGHVFERESVEKWFQESKQANHANCPTCRTAITGYQVDAEKQRQVRAYIGDKPHRRAQQHTEASMWEKLYARLFSRRQKAPEPSPEEILYAAQIPEQERQDQLRALRLQRTTANLLFYLKLVLAAFYVAPIGFGIYLATLLVPVIATVLLALGVIPVFAWILGALSGLALVFATWALLAPGGFLSQIFLNGVTKRGGWGFWYFLAFLTGIGFGIYLSVLVGPLLISALVAAGISSGLAGFIAAALGLLLIRATIDWLDLLVSCFGIQGLTAKNSGEQFLRAMPVVLLEFWQTLKFTWERDPWLGLGYGLGWCAGLGLSIYLCILVAPFIVNALALTAASSGVITCLLAIIGLALTTALVRIVPILLNLPIYLGRHAFFSAKGNLIGKSMLNHVMQVIVFPSGVSVENYWGEVQVAAVARRTAASAPQLPDGRGVGAHGPAHRAQPLSDEALAQQLQLQELQGRGGMGMG